MSKNPSLAEILKQGREKNKKEELAQKILGSRGRKTGAGSITTTRNTSEKPSLLSRMSGVGKRSSSAKPDINGKWTHDLHGVNNPDGPPRKKGLNRAVSSSQIDRNTRTFEKYHSTLQRNARNGNGNENSTGNGNASSSGGFSFRGAASAGPFTVIASNFALGTTAADIEAVMGSHSVALTSCKIISSKPTVMAEMVFDKKEDAHNIVATFNNKNADGRTLHLYMKEPTAAIKGPTPNQSAQRATRAFDDMDIDTVGSATQYNTFRDSTGLNPPRGPRRRF
ncbi:hypothetical protein EJ04DRAFT_429746 [Polyplosphaeria fusca]|uniref:RRM domain-containing protein n=1 Tax=Polyplosphaeria fusca TaxID=682080 RepID=A0A9P4R7K2_9PLEO|nr:hypothetical protein EJ04DRAFT_429746 [Polyplosphaeria fusca]